MDRENCMIKVKKALEYIAKNNIKDKTECRDFLLDIRKSYYINAGEYREKVAKKLANEGFAG